MNVLLTGANGFIGTNLVKRLLLNTDNLALQSPITKLVLIDREITTDFNDARVKIVEGSIHDDSVLGAVFNDEFDFVFHLASVPGGMAEKDFDLGMDVNLYATIKILEGLRKQAKIARIVFASSIAVYGVPMPDIITEETIALPSLSYGMQKMVGESLIAEYSRRGFIDGISLRLPGIVARPQEDSGLMSAFLSNLIHDLSSGKKFDCPVSGDGKTWWMSINCVIDNFIHAALLPVTPNSGKRTWLLPVLFDAIEDVVAAIANLHGEEVLNRVTYHDDQQLQNQFANYPPLDCPTSLAAGFTNDGSAKNLVKNSLDWSLSNATN